MVLKVVQQSDLIDYLHLTYDELVHGGEGSGVGGTGSTVEDNEETGQEEEPKNNDGIPEEEGEDDTKNPRGL